MYYECTEWKLRERTKYMDEKDFELLQALADSRNITKAADKLYITQSALSKRIRSIERELGVELLLRSHQGIRFTPSGEAVLAHCRAAAPEMEQMRRKLVCGFRHCLRGDGKTGPGLGNRSGNRAERI